ncbi:outer membrane beta-barrel protein [Gemmatimonas aurantiaca]|uniref:outer membrane beta-barrel protein n=1 Tax=Gemmatimonas aurantiaca TaxID=173480 RepID=UPI00301CAFD8
MTARFTRLAVAAALVAALPLAASAQSKTFTKGDRVASINFLTGGDYNGSGVGAQAEWGLLPIGKATLGIGAFVGYVKDSQTYGSFKGSNKVMPIMAVGNIHFPIESQPKLDLYAGASVGFVHWSWDTNIPSSFGYDASSTDSGFGIQGGARYWLGSKLGVNGQIGFGDIPLLHAGISFKF